MQLRKQKPEPNTLLAAAIEVKAAEITPVRLSSAINLNVN
jgi:hypothetical protein